MLTCLANDKIWLDRFYNPAPFLLDDGIIINSGKFDGMTNSEEDRKKLLNLSEEK